jgi:hypothetical protein
MPLRSNGLLLTRTRLFLRKKIKRLIRKDKGFTKGGGDVGFMRKKRRQGMGGEGKGEYRGKAF